MDSTAGYTSVSCDPVSYDLDYLPPARGKRLQNHSEKKRYKPLRKNRKPSRPANHIGQRTNNRLQRICRSAKSITPVDSELTQ